MNRFNSRLHSLIGVLLFFSCYNSFGINPLKPRDLILKEVVELAIKQSPEAMNAINRRENAFWRYRNFQTGRRPQLFLNGNLPDFVSANAPVTQPDGSVSFRSQNLSKSSLSMSLNQEIALTGTQIYAAADVMRIDNFDQKTVAYSGRPVLIGFHQPIFAFNASRWNKKIEPLIWEESQKQFDESIELISKTATNLFFAFLSVQTNFELAESNLNNSQQNYKIASVKSRLGKISENEYARVKLSVFNARKALSSAKMRLSIAEFELKAFIGFNQSEKIKLVMPVNVPKLTIDVQKALEYARQNRKEIPLFNRLLLQADKEKIKARRANGLTAFLDGSYGLTSSNKKLSSLLKEHETMKTIKLSFNIPIVDWGRSASRVKMAESSCELTRYEVEQQQQKFDREVIVQAGQFSLLYEQIETSRQADQVAEASYNIALRQYQNGNLSITDLNIALQEREQSRRDYIESMSQFWDAYFNIRRLTLYDFENHERLTYYTN